MTVRERVLAIRLVERVNRQQNYANNIGIAVEFKAKSNNTIDSKEKKE